MLLNEMDEMFDVLFNNITSNQAPGLNAYEKSVFLTKGQDEVLKNYFTPSSKGNNTGIGFDGNQKRQIDFSSLTKVASYLSSMYTYTIDSSVTDGGGNPTYTRSSSTSPTTYAYHQAYDAGGAPIADHYVRDANAVVSGLTSALYDPRPNSMCATLPSDIMMIINERVDVTRGSQTVYLNVSALSYDEYSRLMSKPYKRPVKYQAWRLIISDSQNKADLIVGPNDTITNYTIRYIKRPNPIIVSDLDGLTIDGKGGPCECELDPILHEEILQRAVELAKVSWTATGQDNAQLVLQAGQRSE